MAKREDPFARVPKSALDDPRLSWRAKGVLSYLLGKPTGWKVRISDLENKSTDGQAAIRSALKELRMAGYAKLERIVGEKGKIAEWTWKISDSAIFSPDHDSPHVGNPLVENHHLSKNDPNKNDPTKNKSEESKETSSTEDAAFSSEWKPDRRSKEDQLKAIRVPSEYPSQAEFDEFVGEQACWVSDYRPDMYSQLCDNKWHQWQSENNKWARIRDWQKYVLALDTKIDKERAPF